MESTPVIGLRLHNPGLGETALTLQDLFRMLMKDISEVLTSFMDTSTTYNGHDSN